MRFWLGFCQNSTGTARQDRADNDIDKLVNDMTITKEPVNQEEAKLVALAKTDIAFGPRYLTGDEGVFERSTSDLEKFFAIQGIPTSRVPDTSEDIVILERSAVLPCVLPVIIISGACLLQNPALVEAVMTVLSNYIKDHFAGSMGGAKNVKCKIVTGDTKIFYDGSPEGFKEIKSILEKIKDEQSGNS